MSALTTERIARLITRRERLTNRRDGRINFPAVDEIDEKLREVPAGERPDVDALLGRYPSMRPATDTSAATAHVAELASDKMSEFEAHMRLLCADYEIEAPDYPGMWK